MVTLPRRFTAPATAEPADIVLTRGTGLLSRLIRFFTRSVGEPRTKANHVGVIVEAGTPPQNAILVEALSRVKKHSLERYVDGKTQVAIYRATNLTNEEKTVIVKAANRYVGRPYGVFKMFLHLLDWTLQGTYWFRRLSRSDSYPICSWLVAHSYAKAGKYFGVDPGAASPDDIADFVEKSHHYVCIRGFRPLDE